MPDFICNIVTHHQQTFMVVSYLLSYMFIVIINRCLEDGDKCEYKDLALNFHTRCIYYGDNDVVHSLIKGRAENYFFENSTSDISPEQKEVLKNNSKHCLLTIWGLTHFILYFLLGIFAPDYFWLSFSISIAFEYYENLKWDCHDMFDILLNTIGLFAGYYTGRYLCTDIVDNPIPGFRPSETSPLYGI